MPTRWAGWDSEDRLREGRARVDSAGNAGERWLKIMAGEEGAGEVGSKRGEPEATPRGGRAGGDRLRGGRALVAHLGDDGDMKARDECSLMLEEAWWIRGGRLLSDRPESVELALDGDERPALFCGVGGASASSIWASTSLWGRSSAGNGEVMLGREMGLGSSTLTVRRCVVGGSGDTPAGPVGKAPFGAGVTAVDAANKAAPPVCSGHKEVAQAA